MQDPTIGLEDESLSLPMIDREEEDLDIGGKDQTAYYEACRVYEDKLKARKAMKPRERAAAAELERCQGLLRMLKRPPASDEEMTAFFIMISDTPDQVNAPVDPAGNTLAHYLANPNEMPASWNGDQPTMRPTTQREQQALSEWSEVILQWASADPFIPNHRGITAADIACTVGPDQVELLVFFDKNTGEREKLRAIARAVCMAAAGQSQAQVTTDDIDNAILGLGKWLDIEGGFLLCNNQLRSADTFREFLTGDQIQDPKLRRHIAAVLLPKSEASKL